MQLLDKADGERLPARPPLVRLCGQSRQRSVTLLRSKVAEDWCIARYCRAVLSRPSKAAPPAVAAKLLGLYRGPSLAVGATVGTRSEVLLAHDRALGCADGKQEAI